ncbi:hypothetical protein [Mycobacterium sp.]|uniref:hypothetical protein n=1 Tax=Mycobacterium sp. TaxID=1785 RepID=UPI003BAF8128
MPEITHTTTTHPDVPLPDDVEFYEDEWHESPNGAGHYRRFAAKKFPVFDWLTVHTGGTQFVQDDAGVFVVRDVRVLGRSLDPSHALALAEALLEAAVYASGLERDK